MLKKIPSAVCAAVLTLFLSFPSGALDLEILSEDFKNLWRGIAELSGSNDEALLKDRDDYGWSLFHSYDSFFENAIDILTEKESGRIVREVFELQDSILKNNRKKEELKSQYFSAPDSSWNPFATTKESIDKDLKKLDERNEQNRKNISGLRDKLQDSLEKHGIIIETEQLDFMLSSVSGRTLSQMLLVTDSLKQVLGSIEEQMKQNSDSVVVKRYASIYLVTILALRHAQDIALEDLKQNARKIDKLIEQAHEAIKEARAIPGFSTDKVLLSNVKLNTRTVVIAKKYKEILTTYRSMILKERPNIDRNIKVARNMYNTVNIASSLISAVHQSSADYRALFRFSMPAINEIYATSLNTEFDQISERLNQME